MKYLSKAAILIYITFTFIIFSCNSDRAKPDMNTSGGNEVARDSVTTDSAKMISPVPPNPDVAIRPAPIDSLRVDTSKEQPTQPLDKKGVQMGSAAYYCPSKMIKDQEYFVTVSISKGSLQNLIEQIKEDTKAINPSAKMGDVKGDSIPLADRMKVELICSDQYFTIVHSPASLEQDFTDINKLDWEWLIEPKAAISKIPVQIKISGYNLEKNRWIDVIHPGKTFYINVQVDPRNFWDKGMTFLSNNPEFLLSQILIPVITFFAGLWFGRKKKEAK